jgi:DNA-binding beta-propeller fold protein YncE
LHDSYQPVHYFTPEGRYLGGWREGFEGLAPELTSLALAPDGNVYVSDAGDNYAREEGMITYFTGSGEYLGAWLFDNSTPTDSSAPWALAVAPTGNVYIVDAFQDLVQYFTPTGSLLGEWGKEGITPGEFDSPSAIAVGKDGTVYVADSARVQYFTPDGEYIGEFGSEVLPKDGLGSDITGLAVASDGTVYVTDAGNHRVVFFRPVRTGFRFFR